ncbi:hypothetical protein ACE38W_09570 [Chitinophaga sp. Hz27]|uniref:hypothetical protein n=1 Tax=Chitinophaga sp. Hz27 TaxID=3347169 RepID=UPI0035D58151
MKNEKPKNYYLSRRRVNKGIGKDPDLIEDQNGIITYKYAVDGVERIWEISWKQINDAYAKALREYGKKL